MERGASVMTLTSGGGGGPASSLPQALSTSVTAANKPPRRILLRVIAGSIREHSAEQAVELREFFFLEAVEVYVHPVDDDRPDLVGDFLALRRQVQVNHAAIGFTAHAAQQVFFLEPVEHAAHRGEPDLCHARKPGHGV